MSLWHAQYMTTEADHQLKNPTNCDRVAQYSYLCGLFNGPSHTKCGIAKSGQLNPSFIVHYTYVHHHYGRLSGMSPCPILFTTKPSLLLHELILRHMCQLNILPSGKWVILCVDGKGNWTHSILSWQFLFELQFWEHSVTRFGTRDFIRKMLIHSCYFLV